MTIRRKAVIRPNQIPRTVAGLESWFDIATIDALGLADSTAITTWANSSGKASHDITQGTAAAKPTYRTNQINGHGSASFDGARSLKGTAFTSIAQPYMVFGVWKRNQAPVGAGAQYRFFDGNTDAQATLYTSQSTTACLSWAGASLTTGTIDQNYRIWCWLANGASSKLRVDGGAGSTGNAGTQAITNITLGAGGGGGNNLQGHICEVMLYAGSLALADINRLGGYLANKYALTWNTAT